MKFTLCIVALAIMVSVEAVPAPVSITLPTNEEDYFREHLESIQGALTDTMKAGQDLEVMETSLQAIVNASEYIWRAESATEYATSSSPYENEWKQ